MQIKTTSISQKVFHINFVQMKFAANEIFWNKIIVLKQQLPIAKEKKNLTKKVT